MRLDKLKTIIWQKTNAHNLFKEKIVNGETIRLYKIPNGISKYTMIGYRGKKGLDPVRQVEINAALRLNNQARNFGVVDACKKNTVKTVTTTDLTTGNNIYFCITADGSYLKNAPQIDTYSLLQQGIKVDLEKPVSFSTIELPCKNLSLEEGYVHSARKSITKIQTDKGTLVQTVEQYVTTNNELYHMNGDDKKVIADKITLYLNGEKIKEYLSPIIYGSKAIG